MRKLIFISGTILLFISTLFISCSKSKKEEVKQTASDNTIAETSFNDIYNQVDLAARNQATGNKSPDSLTCAFITISPSDTTSFPKTITIDYGAGCTGNDGITRTGKIVATLTGKYRQTGTVITVTLEDYSRNGNEITGTKTITNKGKNNDNHTWFEIKVENASINTENGLISWESTREREWIEGEDTYWPNLTDDVYLITGSATGTNVNDKEFTVTITEALRIEIGCKHIVSGILELEVDGQDLRTLDYGDGNCDNHAILTIKNNTYDITLN